MHLLNTTTLRVEPFLGKVPAYAILSHTWGPEEVTYGQLADGRESNKSKRGYEKIENASRLAYAAGYDYIWVDTCCIDKQSSAELSEAINSMYRYYQEAKICFAHLEDVDTFEAERLRSIMDEGGHSPEEATEMQELEFRRSFSKSHWFTRGWTLQELIAPQVVEFYSQDWQYLGTKSSLCDVISTVTSINIRVLTSGFMNSCSVAEKVSWASYRQTTRAEDMSYCLLGLFGVNMPLLYGEGTAAFTRLQDEILKQQEDPSVFLWGRSPRDRPDAGLADAHPVSVLAEDPRAFASRLSFTRFPGNQRFACRVTDMVRISFSAGHEVIRNLPAIFPNGLGHLTSEPPASTTGGLRMSMNILQFKTHDIRRVDLLYAWTHYMIAGRFVCMVLKSQQMATDTVFLRLGPLCVVETTSVKTVLERRIYLGLNGKDTHVESSNTPEYPEPTLVLRGIRPSSAVMNWWDKKDRRSQESSTNISMSGSESSKIESILINDLFHIVPTKERSSDEANEADSVTVIVGSAGNQLWCRVVCQNTDVSMQETLKRLQNELEYRPRKFGDCGFRDSSMGGLPNNTLARARVRPGRAVDQVTVTDGTRPYVVYISVLWSNR